MWLYAPLAFAVTAVLTLALRPLAFRLHLTDNPGGRKRHLGEIPLVGGIAMLIGILVTAMIALKPASLGAFLVSTVLLVSVGVFDDRYDTRTSTRLAAQICAALVMMLGGGLYLRDIGDPFGSGLLGLGFLAIPISVVITLGVINAFNFIDGIDGLAAFMALIALTAGALAAGLRAPAVAMAAMTCGAVLGFLLFNFPAFRNRHLRTFMGDAGSALLGFVIVWFALTITQGGHRSLSPVAALWFVLMPLSDFVSCIVKRAAKGKLPFHPGREHFHYMLMRAGLSGRQVLAVLVAFGVFYAAVGLIGVSGKLPDWMLFAPWITLLALQHFIIKHLAMRVRHHRWNTSKAAVVLASPLSELVGIGKGAGATAALSRTEFQAGRNRAEKPLLAPPADISPLPDAATLIYFQSQVGAQRAGRGSP